MYTQCPKCMTCFQVTAEHLKVAQGNVRCGQCRNVFSALGNLSEIPPQNSQDGNAGSTGAKRLVPGNSQSKLSSAIAAIQALNKSSQKILSDGRKAYIANLSKQSQARKQYSTVNSGDATARDLSNQNIDPDDYPDITDENEQLVAADVAAAEDTNINFDEAMKAVDEIEIEDEEDTPIRYGHDDGEDITPAFDASHLVADYAIEESYVAEDNEFEDLEDIARELESPVEVKLSPASKSKNITETEKQQQLKEQEYKAQLEKSKSTKDPRGTTTVIESYGSKDLVSDDFDFSDLGDNILPPLDEPEQKVKPGKNKKQKDKPTKQDKASSKPGADSRKTTSTEDKTQKHKKTDPKKKEKKLSFFRREKPKPEPETKKPVEKPRLEPEVRKPVEKRPEKPVEKPKAAQPQKQKEVIPVKAKSPLPATNKPATPKSTPIRSATRPAVQKKAATPRVRIKNPRAPAKSAEPPVLEIPKQLLADFQQVDHVSIWHHKSAMKWGAGSLILMLVFLVQTVYFKHNELGQISQLRPWIEFFCKHASCELALQADIGQIELLGQDIRSHPKTKKALLVSATIINNAKFNQPYPGLRLNFSNMNGQKIAARDFKPEDYLNKEIPLKKGMESNTPIQIVLEILDPGKNAVNFEFDFFSI